MGYLNCEDPFKESAAISRRIENKLSWMKLANKLFDSLNLYK